MTEESDHFRRLMDAVLAGDGDALATLFSMYRDRLRRMVELRMDARLQGRIDQVGDHRSLEVGPSFVDDDLGFRAAGGSTRPDELVKRIGMDITNPAFWDAGLDILAGMVAEVERLASL